MIYSAKNKYYIYAHINATDNSIFYIGKGCGKRAKDKSNRSKWWKNIVNKYGYIVTILEFHLTHEEALEREIWFIDKLGRIDMGIGTLVNMTDGGDGVSGYKPTKEKLEFMSKLFKGRISPNKGNKYTDETKRILSIRTTEYWRKIKEEKLMMIF